ncbi:RICIN domain-containing protein [Streptomyces sp. NPDC005805]|uniref:RICIN domain-containing protein n=1 Tax=Streptomyces sp. NPDC005805 TaxID=3157068 RepID=UPI0033D6094A
MPGRRRLRKQRRGTPRRLILATAAVAVMAVVGGVAYEATRGADGGSPQPLAQGEPAAAGPAVEPAKEPAREKEPEPLTEVPKSEPERGMVYRGLKPAPEGDPCAGVYRTTGGHCTHGPDAPPKGVDITKDTPPAVRTTAPAEDPAESGSGKPARGTGGSGGSSGTLPRTAAPALDATAPGTAAKAPSTEGRSGASGDPRSPQDTQASRAPAANGPAGQTVQCDGDGSSGNRVQVVYVHAPGKDRYAQYFASFRKWAADADLIFSESAKDTGGVRHIRYVTAADCTPTVLNIELPAAALAEFSATNRALAAKGLDRRDRKYMIFADSQVYCGIGTFAGDERPGQNNLSNFGPSYGRTDTGCWGGHTAAHELGHNLGAVNNSAPNTSRGAHCTDEWDVMCYSDSPYYPTMRNVCRDRGYENRLDCNNDDYFHTNPRPGSYLATHWNIADNQFLMRGTGTTPNPRPTPTPSPAPTKPTPTPRPTNGTGTGPAVTVGQTGPDFAVAGWQPVAGAVWYQVFLDGRAIGWVQTTSTRVYNLKPGTAHTLAVSVRDASGRDSGPGRATSFRTTGGGGGGTTPTPGTRQLLTNGATGAAAEIWGGHSADNTVLVGSQRTGYAQQQWYFDNAGNGYSRIRSAVSGKCLQSGGAPSAGMWVAQQPCRDIPAQRWRITAGGSGVTITAGDSSYALGVSNRPYYGSWLIELQQRQGATGAPAQVWTVQKAS